MLILYNIIICCNFLSYSRNATKSKNVVPCFSTSTKVGFHRACSPRSRNKFVPISQSRGKANQSPRKMNSTCKSPSAQSQSSRQMRFPRYRSSNLTSPTTTFNPTITVASASPSVLQVKIRTYACTDGSLP